MEATNLHVSTPLPAIHLLVTQGGDTREATLVDPCVLYLLKQKRDEGMFLSSSLGDLLAPMMGVKILWSGTNRTEIVQASSIRIIQGHSWQHQQQEQFPMMAQQSRAAEESILERNRLISTLRDSSSLESQTIRTQFLPQSLLGQANHLSGDDIWNSESFNKRRKLNNYSSWLQERCKSISPETTMPTQSMTGAYGNRNPLLNSFGDLQNLQQSIFNRPEPTKAPVIAKNRMSNSNNSSSSLKSLREENEFLQRLLTAKRSSHQSGMVSRPFDAKKTVLPPVKTASEPVTFTKASSMPPTDTGKEWNAMYERLLKHMGERGLEKVPNRIHMDPELRNWVAQQRLDFKKRNLNSERQVLLRSIGFHRDKFTLKWDAKFERLKDFKKEHGHTNVPFHYAKDRQLGTWVSKQRVRIRQGTISTEEKIRLEAIGFVPNRFNARWEEMFRRLVAYKRVYGDSNVPRVYEKDSQLAQWVLNQKDAFREGKMKPERQIKLEAIGFSWSTFYEGDLEWEKNFQKILSHKTIHGQIRFFKDQKLARWVALQQSLCSMGTLNEQRKELLVSIGLIPNEGACSTTDKKASQQHQSIQPSSIPPMGLQQSFSDWKNSAENSQFFL
eukprot:CAMPEP_0116083336 /NCGR_PEP_ID=MMETSP0327-20121206/3217_1 /TAXON_ID=44447 /ORGANISM="Pseudo-nitzschia delicatissima, Strain B596" /LENGTH=612 /DNA_ID=CAMNT_0003574213 /DNA_START=401 /DNA_END=2239 /DNA_ORIENTATION=-